MNASVTVAIRPEKFNLTFQQPNVQTNVVEGTMQAAAYLGDRSHFIDQRPVVRDRPSTKSEPIEPDLQQTIHAPSSLIA